MKSFYFIYMTMEVLVRKKDLHLGLMDGNNSVYRFALEQVDDHYSPDRYVRTEHHDCFVYSLKKDSPAKPLMEVRRRVYELMGIAFDQGAEWKEEELKGQLEGVDIGGMVSVSQNCLYRVDERYPFFMWRKCKRRLGVQWSPGSIGKSLPILCGGIQLYFSRDSFVTEFDGGFDLLTDPLLYCLDDMPYADTISVEIQDVDDKYGEDIF